MNFSKRDRLTSREEFRAVFDAAHEKSARSRRIFRSGPYVIYQKNTEGATRIGITIARRVIKKAHDRNRIKRCIREYFRLNREQFHGDFIVKVSQEPEAYDFKTLCAPFSDLTAQLNESVKK